MWTQWSFALARLVGVLALGCVLGSLSGYFWAGLVLMLCAFIVSQLLALYRLHHWLHARPKAGPPVIGGIWGDIVAQVERLNRRKRYHKQRTVQLLGDLRRSTRSLPDGVVILSAQHEILWFNPPAARLLGLKRNTDVGLRIHNLVRVPEFVRYLHAKNFKSPCVINPPLHTEWFLAVQAVPFGTEQTLLLIQDITRQRHVEAMRKDFVANASHELRTPLTVISGYLDTMAEDSAIDPAWSGPIRDMRSQAQRMGAIVKDLLELSRLESAGGEAARDALDVPALLKRLHRDALARADRPAKVTLALESEDGLYACVRDIESAFTNLLVNALSYTPAAGSVHMRWWSDADGAHFSVVDTGIGIAAQHLPRITERFYRVDASRSRERGGSGLGLAIVKHAMQLHGAWLEVQSVEDQGSTFTCHFPRERVRPGQAAEHLAPLEAASSPNDGLIQSHR